MTSGQGDAATARKVRGAFFTPAPLCKYVADWAVRTAGDKVLEPTCGEAAFLLAAGERLEVLAGTAGGARGQIDGVEVHERSNWYETPPATWRSASWSVTSSR